MNRLNIRLSPLFPIFMMAASCRPNSGSNIAENASAAQEFGLVNAKDIKETEKGNFDVTCILNKIESIEKDKTKEQLIDNLVCGNAPAVVSTTEDELTLAANDTTLKLSTADQKDLKVDEYCYIGINNIGNDKKFKVKKISKGDHSGAHLIVSFAEGKKPSGCTSLNPKDGKYLIYAKHLVTSSAVTLGMSGVSVETDTETQHTTVQADTKPPAENIKYVTLKAPPSNGLLSTTFLKETTADSTKLNDNQKCAATIGKKIGFTAISVAQDSAKHVYVELSKGPQEALSSSCALTKGYLFIEHIDTTTADVSAVVGGN